MSYQGKHAQSQPLARNPYGLRAKGGRLRRCWTASKHGFAQFRLSEAIASSLRNCAKPPAVICDAANSKRKWNNFKKGLPLSRILKSRVENEVTEVSTGI